MGRTGFFVVTGIIAVCLFFIYQVFVCETCGDERIAARKGITLEELYQQREQQAAELAAKRAQEKREEEIREARRAEERAAKKAAEAKEKAQEKVRKAQNKILRKFDGEHEVARMFVRGVPKKFRKYEWRRMRDYYAEPNLHASARDHLKGADHWHAPNLLLFIEVDRDAAEPQQKYQLKLFVRGRWDGCSRSNTCGSVKIQRTGWDEALYLGNPLWQYDPDEVWHDGQQYAVIPMTDGRIEILSAAAQPKKEAWISYGDGRIELHRKHRESLRKTIELYQDLIAVSSAEG